MKSYEQAIQHALPAYIEFLRSEKMLNEGEFNEDFVEYYHRENARLASVTFEQREMISAIYSVSEDQVSHNLNEQFTAMRDDENLPWYYTDLLAWIQE